MDVRPQSWVLCLLAPSSSQSWGVGVHQDSILPTIALIPVQVASTYCPSSL